MDIKIIKKSIESIEKGNLNDVKKDIKSGIDINSVDNFNDSLLNHACHNDQFDIVQFLIENGADINYVKITDINHTPLMLACLIGSLKIVKFLIKNRANVNFKNNNFHNRTALICAIESDKINLELILFLLKNKADIFDLNIQNYNRILPILRLNKLNVMNQIKIDF